MNKEEKQSWRREWFKDLFLKAVKRDFSKKVRQKKEEVQSPWGRIMLV